MPEERDKLKKKLLIKKEPEDEDLENSYPMHIEKKNEKTWCREIKKVVPT